MLLERYYEESLAQASYLIGCERAREAIIIDPNREVEHYVRAAAAHRMRIVAVTETHIHADYLSGSRDLAAASRSKLLLSGHGGASWQYTNTGDATLLKNGDGIDVGSVHLEVLHTPGHTPEHVVFLVTDRATGGGAKPMGIVSGDFLFVGDVGRPDLLERAAKVAGSMDQAARELYASLQRLAALPDYLQVWPGHGAGSACGKALGAVPQTTLGYERLFNPAFQQKSESEFVRWVLADQPEPPPYFAVMKQLNRDGPTTGTRRDSLPQLQARDVVDGIRTNWVVDLRGSSDFARGHVAGTINIPGGSQTFPTYAGTVLTYDRPIIFVAKSADQAESAARRLALIGLERISGWIPFDVLRNADPEHLATVGTIDPARLAEELRRNGPRVIDVRGRSEWNEGHLPRATHIYLGELMARVAESDPEDRIVVHCASGTRSSIAASLLMARGFRDVSNLVGGFDAWRRAGLPVEQ
jgi:hydroxyacylglutathione hydrolase